jgi:hypothetical protein
MHTKEAIARELATERAKLDELEHQLSTVRANLVRAELHAVRTAKPSLFPLSLAVTRQTPDTPAEKVKLSRSLFRGHTDVFPSDSSARKPATPATHLSSHSLTSVSNICTINIPSSYAMPLHRVGDGGLLEHHRVFSRYTSR